METKPKSDMGSWDTMLNKLQKFQDKTGHLNPTKTNRPGLAQWVQNQRRKAKAGKLSDEHKVKLESIGFSFNDSKKQAPKWPVMFDKLRAYKLAHGNCSVPPPRQYPQDPEFARWVRGLSTRKSRMMKACPARVEKLNALGFEWNATGEGKKPQNFWKLKFAMLVEYKNENGDCNVPVYHPKLGKWVQRQRSNHKKMQKYNPHKVEKLNELGFDWNGPVADSDVSKGGWEKKLAMLVEYKNENESCNVPGDHPKLGKWVQRQRAQHKKMQKFNPKKVEKLNELGFDWNGPGADSGASKGGWENKFAMLVEYKVENGDCNVPGDYPKLGQWVQRQRAQHKKMQKFQPRKVEKLNELGFDWNGPGTDSDEMKSGWDDKFAMLVEYKNENGDCDVPEDHPKLGHWVQRQRAKRNEMQEVQPYKVEKLNGLGFDWNGPGTDSDVLKGGWDDNFAMLVEYKNENGDCNVPGDHPKLGQWVQRQRAQHKKMQKFNPRKVKKLKELGFDWNGSGAGSNVSKGGWDDKFAMLVEYKNENGDCNVPGDHPKLGQWVQRQRAQHKKMQKFNPRKVKKLNELGFSWNGYEDEIVFEMIDDVDA